MLFDAARAGIHVAPGATHASVRIAREALRRLARGEKTETAWGVFGVERFVLTDGSVLFNEDEGAPAQQVAHEAHVLDMSDAQALAELIAGVQPDIIIPEIEAIATQVLFDAERAGSPVGPRATIAAICRDREARRRGASDELGLPTSPHRFAGSLEELRAGAQAVGFPCVV